MLSLSDEIGELFTNRQSFEEKVKTFVRVAHKRFSDIAVRNEVAQLASEMRTWSGRRNDVIHAYWRPDFGPLDKLGSNEPPRIVASTRKLDGRGGVTREIPTDPPALFEVAK
jgi:hypothetical protein